MLVMDGERLGRLARDRRWAPGKVEELAPEACGILVLTRAARHDGERPQGAQLDRDERRDVEP